MTPPMSDPTTRAERSLLAFLWEERKHTRFDGPQLVKHILAIEVEARAPYLAVVEAARDLVEEWARGDFGYDVAEMGDALVSALAQLSQAGRKEP